jgi:ATP-dependent Zn protease
MKLAEKTESATGAVIENIVNEAATKSFTKNKDFIDKDELEEVCNRNIKEYVKFKNYEYKNNIA